MAIETFPHPSDPGFTPEFETADGTKYYYNGFGWEMQCSSGGGGDGGPQMVYYGTDVPTGDIPTGSLFTHEDTLKQFVLQDDGTWVETDGCNGGGGIIDPDLSDVSPNISLTRISQGNRAVWLGVGQVEPVADDQGRVGWYYQHPGDGTKAHWTLWSQETNAYKDLTLGDLTALSFLIMGSGELPYVQIYTKRKFDGNDASSTYRSRITYLAPDNVGGLSSVALLTTNPDTDIYSNINRLEFVGPDPVSTVGPQEADEEINKIVVSVNSASAAGLYDFLLQAMIIESKLGTYEMQLEITSDGSGGSTEQMVYYGQQPPSSAETGSLFTQEDTLHQYVLQADDTWVATDNCSGGGGSGEQMVYYGQQPPTNAITGSFFTQEDTLKVYVLQADGTWVETSSCGGADLQAILDTINPFVTYEPSNITGDDIKIYHSSGSSYTIRPTTNYNNIGSYKQTAEIDVNGDGNWVDIATLSASHLNTYSLSKGSSGGNSYLVGVPTQHGGIASDPNTWPNTSYPDIKIRYWTENIVNDRYVKVYTGEISPYIQTHSYP